MIVFGGGVVGRGRGGDLAWTGARFGWGGGSGELGRFKVFIVSLGLLHGCSCAEKCIEFVIRDS